MSIKLACGVVSVAFLSACTGLVQKVNNDFAQQDVKTSTLLKDVGRTAPGAAAKGAPSVVTEKGIWLGKNIVKVGQSSLPPVFFEDATFDRTVNSLSELAERITLRSGIPTKVSTDAMAVANAVLQSNATGMAPGGAGLQQPPGMANQVPVAPAAMQGMGGIGGMGGAMRPSSVRITYAGGSFKGLLDTVSARFGVYWKYQDGVIQFFHTDSRTFQVNAVPGDSSFNANITSGAISTGGISGGMGGGGAPSAGGGVNANSTQNTAVASRLSVYSSIEKSVAAMLSSYGRVVASPATGTITVVDTPDTLERVASFIENENKALSRQVVINVTVLSVSLNDGDQYGINWDLVYRTLDERFGIRNTVSAAPNAVGFSAGILSTASSRFAGSTVLINALSEQGKVRQQTTASVVTLNNQPVPVQVAKQTSYLQSSQTTVTSLVGTTTTLVPGTVTSGFNMSILPHVLNNGTVMLQFSTDISSLRNIRTVSSNGNSIESPEMDTRNFLQRVAMKSNETLVVSGFEQTDDNVNHSGVGEPRNMLLGGGFKATSSKEIIVILVTPTMVAS